MEFEEFVVKVKMGIAGTPCTCLMHINRRDETSWSALTKARLGPGDPSKVTNQSIQILRRRLRTQNVWLLTAMKRSLLIIHAHDRRHVPRINRAQHTRDVTVVYTLLRAGKLRVVNFRRIAKIPSLGPLRSVINAALYIVYRPLRASVETPRASVRLKEKKKPEREGDFLPQARQ